MARTRAVVVKDFDGTCTPKDQSQWQAIDERLPAEGKAQMKTLRARYHELANGDALTSAQETRWLEESLSVYVNHRISTEDIEAGTAKIALRPGVAESLERLYALGVPVAIISYGVRAFISHVLEQHGVAHLVDHIAAAHLEMDASGRAVAYDPSTLVLPWNKGFWSRQFADKHGVPHERIIAVGDSGGDRLLGHLTLNRAGIAADAAEAAKLAKHVGQVFVTDHFCLVTDWIIRKL